jgi:hypothetical protein
LICRPGACVKDYKEALSLSAISRVGFSGSNFEIRNLEFEISNLKFEIRNLKSNSPESPLPKRLIASMFEVTHVSENHREAMLVGGGDYFFVAD